MEEEGKVLSPSEAAEYGEFKRARREAEISFTLTKLVIDASRRETDRAALKRACETAVRLNASGVLVSPVNVAAARKLLGKSETPVCCLVGGSGESLMTIKRLEAKKAFRMGARQIRLVLCYSQLMGGGFQYLKREIKRVRRAVRKGTLTVSLEDHSLDVEEVAFGVRAAALAGADTVCVRGESGFVLRAVKEAGGRMTIEASGVENAEQLRLLMKSGAMRVTTGNGDRIADELYQSLNESHDSIQGKDSE